MSPSSGEKLEEHAAPYITNPAPPPHLHPPANTYGYHERLRWRISFFFFFFVRWFIESCNPLSYQQPLTANTSVDTLQYIKARKKKHKNRLYTATSYSSLEHKQVVNSYVFFVPGWKNAHKWFLKGKIHPNICYHWLFLKRSPLSVKSRERDALQWWCVAERYRVDFSFCVTSTVHTWLTAL